MKPRWWHNGFGVEASVARAIVQRLSGEPPPIGHEMDTEYQIRALTTPLREALDAEERKVAALFAVVEVLMAKIEDQ